VTYQLLVVPVVFVRLELGVPRPDIIEDMLVGLIRDRTATALKVPVLVRLEGVRLSLWALADKIVIVEIRLGACGSRAMRWPSRTWRPPIYHGRSDPATSRGTWHR